MSVQLVLFLVLAVIAVGSALGMLVSRNAVYSVLFLIVNFATVAVFYLLLEAPFIAIAQITVYAGAILVLFLFVIMLLGAEQLRNPHTMPWQRPMAVVFGLVLLAETGYIIWTQQGSLPAGSPLPKGFGSPQAIGNLLFNQYLLPFEITSILLLAAMVGAIVLTRTEKVRPRDKR